MRLAAAALVASVCATIIPASSLAAPTDAQVMQAVLTHFAERTDTMSLHEDGVILVESDTYAWTNDRLRFFSLNPRSNGKCEIAPADFDAIVKRNAHSVSVTPMLAPAKRWRTKQAGDLDGGTQIFLDKTESGDPIKTIAKLSRPAYSVDRSSAFVLFHFRWSIHGAMAQYVVQRSTEGWTVRCSDLVFYP